MAWEMTWPLAALDLAVVTMIHGVLNVQGETLDSIWAERFFCGVPGVVRRALGVAPTGITGQPRGHSRRRQRRRQFSGTRDALF